jgi:SAM-dependent methyltransferase
MPHSTHWPLTPTLSHVVRLQPRSVLDLGCGYGKWGYLVRECLDFIPRRLEREQWQTRIDGIDAFRAESPLLDWIYDDYRITNILDVADSLRDYDLVILGDVIEHLEKVDGERLLEQLRARNGCVLVNTPRIWFEQDAIAGNPFERHRSFWSAADFARMPAEIEIWGDTLIAAIRGTGAYPDQKRVTVSRLVQRLPWLRSHGHAASAANELLRRISGVRG